ncbi:MAG TPA: XdhC family protein [Bacteroidota bacterium]|nr:XdhC family protein [Bacteroidota bacterium]
MSVFSEICAGLREGRGASLATIIRVSGPAPAPLHSKMLVWGEPGFGISGTVGGGCLDASVIRLLKGRETGDGRGTGRPCIEKFALDDELGETAMTCGGKVEVLLEALTPDMLPVFEKIESRLQEGADCVLATRLGGSGEGRASGGRAGRGKFLIDPEVNTSEQGHPEQLPFGRPGQAALPGPLDTIRRFQAGADTYLLEFLEAPPRLIVFGGGHLGKAVTDFAAPSGFLVTVVDDRPEFTGNDRYPDGTQTLCRRFDLIWSDLQFTDRTFVVIATRGHKHDEMILENCLRCHPRYLGMIGSRRKVHLTFRSLQAKGISADRLSSVHAPIGLKIGALTPEEIGISIVAEMIAVRRSPTGR